MGSGGYPLPGVGSAEFSRELHQLGTFRTDWKSSRISNRFELVAAQSCHPPSLDGSADDLFPASVVGEVVALVGGALGGLGCDLRRAHSHECRSTRLRNPKRERGTTHLLPGQSARRYGRTLVSTEEHCDWADRQYGDVSPYPLRTEGRRHTATAGATGGAPPRQRTRSKRVHGALG